MRKLCSLCGFQVLSLLIFLLLPLFLAGCLANSSTGSNDGSGSSGNSSSGDPSAGGSDGGGSNAGGGGGGDVSGGGNAGSWSGISGSLSGGSWHSAARIDAGATAGDYGSLAYAPNGDLYAFYTVLVSGKNNMELVIRRNGGSSWTSQISVLNNSLTANAVFADSNNVYVALENIGTLDIVSSSDAGASWTFVNSYEASGNGNQNAANGQAIPLLLGSYLDVVFTYADWNAVVGGVLKGVEMASETGSGWPINANVIADQVSMTLDTQGAFENNGGDVLVLAQNAYRSTDGGSTFSQVMNSGAVDGTLTAVAAACQQSTTSDIFVANYYSNGSGNLALWGSSDYGETFQSLKTITSVTEPALAKMAAVENLVVLVAADSTQQTLSESHSYDGGLTWSTWTGIVDVSSSGWTIDAIGLAADPTTGTVSLSYSASKSSVRQGVYLMSFY